MLLLLLRLGLGEGKGAASLAGERHGLAREELVLLLMLLQRSLVLPHSLLILPLQLRHLRGAKLQRRRLFRDAAGGDSGGRARAASIAADRWWRLRRLRLVRFFRRWFSRNVWCADWSYRAGCWFRRLRNDEVQVLLR